MIKRLILTLLLTSSVLAAEPTPTWPDGNAFFIPGVNRPDYQKITFLNDVLVIYENGDVFYRGKKCKNNKEVYRALCKTLSIKP